MKKIFISKGNLSEVIKELKEQIKKGEQKWKKDI